MAETVQLRLELRLQEIHDLLNKNLFSLSEIREIITKITRFEYKLKKRPACKDDFLDYIQYEHSLEEIRHSRRAATKKSKSGLSDFSLIKHICSLYDRALSIFWEDIEIWKKYIEFAKNQGSSKVLERLFKKALQLHPYHADFWIMSADWYFTAKGDISTSRALFQRGLRVNPSATKLWLAFFRLELCHVKSLNERRKVLGIDDPNICTDQRAPEELRSAGEPRFEDGILAISIFKHFLSSVEPSIVDIMGFYETALEFAELGHICPAVRSAVIEHGSKDPQMFDKIFNKQLAAKLLKGSEFDSLLNHMFEIFELAIKECNYDKVAVEFHILVLKKIIDMMQKTSSYDLTAKAWPRIKQNLLHYQEQSLLTDADKTLCLELE